MMTRGWESERVLRVWAWACVQRVGKMNVMLEAMERMVLSDERHRQHIAKSLQNLRDKGVCVHVHFSSIFHILF